MPAIAVGPVGAEGGDLDLEDPRLRPRPKDLDHAEAQLLFRLVGPTDDLKKDVKKTVGDLAAVDFYLEIPFMRFERVDGIPNMIAAFTTDIPVFGDSWGKPYLLGPGSIHVAHTDEERIQKNELMEAIQIYKQMVKQLLTKEA